MSINRNEAANAIVDSTAQLIVRNLDSRIVARLRKRAAGHGRWVEAEHREILREALLRKVEVRRSKCEVRSGKFEVGSLK